MNIGVKIYTHIYKNILQTNLEPIGRHVDKCPSHHVNTITTLRVVSGLWRVLRQKIHMIPYKPCDNGRKKTDLLNMIPSLNILHSSEEIKAFT